MVRKPYRWRKKVKIYVEITAEGACCNYIRCDSIVPQSGIIFAKTVSTKCLKKLLRINYEKIKKEVEETIKIMTQPTRIQLDEEEVEVPCWISWIEISATIIRKGLKGGRVSDDEYYKKIEIEDNINIDEIIRQIKTSIEEIVAKFSKKQKLT